MGPSPSYCDRQGEKAGENFGYMHVASTTFSYLKALQSQHLLCSDCRCLICQNSEILLLGVDKYRA